jgi:2-keto-3-deoxy-L-rhamnonate aldolase RhmA
LKRLRERLRSGGYVLGSWVNSGSSVIAEVMALAGFDFLAIDSEHSAVDLPQAQILFQAIASGDPECAPFIRLPGNDYSVTKRFLDAGATGVIAPLIRTRDEAELVVRSVKYPPEGERGVGFARSNQYGSNLQAAVASANENTFVCVQIEHTDSVANIDSILSVSGIDAILIGPYDLSASMGVTAQFDHPSFRDALTTIRHACERHHVASGIHVVTPDPGEVVRRFEEGYRFLAYSLDLTLLNHAMSSGLTEIRGALPGA